MSHEDILFNDNLTEEELNHLLEDLGEDESGKEKPEQAMAKPASNTAPYSQESASDKEIMSYSFEEDWAAQLLLDDSDDSLNNSLNDNLNNSSTEETTTEQEASLTVNAINDNTEDKDALEEIKECLGDNNTHDKELADFDLENWAVDKDKKLDNMSENLNAQFEAKLEIKAEVESEFDFSFELETESSTNALYSTIDKNKQVESDSESLKNLKNNNSLNESSNKIPKEIALSNEPVQFFDDELNIGQGEISSVLVDSSILNEQNSSVQTDVVQAKATEETIEKESVHTFVNIENIAKAGTLMSSLANDTARQITKEEVVGEIITDSLQESLQTNQTKHVEKEIHSISELEQEPQFLKSSEELQDSAKYINHQIHTLKAHLRVVSDTLREFSDISADMISNTRQLQCRSKDDFSTTYEQMYELRKLSMQTRKDIGDLPSMLDLVEDAMESDLYVAETRNV